MKVLLGTEDIAGWIGHFRKGFEKNGYVVTTALIKSNPLHNTHIDYDFKNLYLHKINTDKIEKNKLYSRFNRLVDNWTIRKEYIKHVKQLIDMHDLIVLLWHPYLDSSAELEYAKSKGKKVICIFVGSDVRYFRAFRQEFDVSHWTFPSDWDHSDPSYHLQLIRNAEKHADLIYSVPDQAGLQLRPYYHLQVPLDVNKFEFNIPNNNIPLVVHAPTVPFKKGTDVIENTLDRLRNEGIEFELISVRDMPNHDLLKLLTKADMVVDEIVYNGPGALSFEAMMSGCAVATRHIEVSPEIFRPPVVNITVETIYHKLKQLLTNREWRCKLAAESRSYALKNNSAEQIVQNMLVNLEHHWLPDYQPKFLRNEYAPESNVEINVINQWTDFVKKCDWYADSVPKGQRAGLVF